jgi:biofilm PGA synthesis N-glycosyltransferase PgaC
MKKSYAYVIVSPAKDEERYIELTLESVVSQTVKPALWVIVDDGSQDRTAEIISQWSLRHSFIELVQNGNVGARQPGARVVRAFNSGYRKAVEVPHDFLVKLDCDLSFDPDFFEKILGRFLEDERLGIASGVYLELKGRGLWKEVRMPRYHAAGACKVIRRTCFEEIGGFVAAPGWDTVDEIRAMTRGWRTGHFRDLTMKHHKTEGSGIGVIKTSIMHGEIYYRTGGSKLFFLAKILRRMATKPYLAAGLALGWGYLKSALTHKELLVTEAEARYYKALLRERLMGSQRTSSIWG